MVTPIEQMYSMAPNPAHPMVNGRCYATRLPEEILVSICYMTPRSALACMKTCKKFRGPAITVYWTTLDEQHFRNLSSMADKEIKSDCIDLVRNIDLTFKAGLPPEWVLRSAPNPEKDGKLYDSNPYYSYHSRYKRWASGVVMVSHLIRPMLESLVLENLNPDDIASSLTKVDKLQIMCIRPLITSPIELLPVIAWSVYLETLVLGDKIVGQDKIFIALTQHPLLQHLNLGTLLDHDTVACALAKPKPFARLKSLTLVIEATAVSQLLSALPNLECLHMTTMNTTTESTNDIFNKIGNSNQLEELDLTIDDDPTAPNTRVLITPSTLALIQGHPYLLKFCLSELDPGCLDMGQVTHDDFVNFLARISLEHPEIRVAQYLGSRLGPGEEETVGLTPLLNRIGRACPALKVLVLPGPYSMDAIDMSAPCLFPNLERLKLYKSNDCVMDSSDVNGLKVFDAWANKLKTCAPQLRIFLTRTDNRYTFALKLESVGHWSVLTPEGVGIVTSATVRKTRAPRCLMSM